MKRTTLPPAGSWFKEEGQLDPGEWGFDGTILMAPTPEERQAEADGGPPCDCYVVAERVRHEPYADLIVAAPDMLHALLMAKAFGSQGDTPEGLSVSNIIDLAIAKATGK